MRQLFKQTRVLLPLLVLLAVPTEGFGQNTWGRPWSQSTATIPAEKMEDGNPARWMSFDPISNHPTVLSSWKTAATSDSKWDHGGTCQTAREYVRDALSFADIQVGFGSSSLAGEYFGPLTDTSETNDADVIVIRLQLVSTDGGFGTLIEEAWHRSTGDSDSVFYAISDSLKASSVGLHISECHDEAKEEEDDDDPKCGAGAGGASADCGGGSGPPEPTCTEQQVYVRWTEWESVTERTQVYVETGGSDSDDGTDDDPYSGYHMVYITTTHWVEVQKGEWRTETVCTT